MDAVLKAAVEARLALAGGAARVMGSRPAGGGCINDARLLELSDGRRLFLKSNPAPLPGMFEAEAEGLRALAAADAIRVPREPLVGGGAEGAPPFLLMEAVPTSSPSPGFFRDFGRRFARLHRGARGEAYGFAADNYIGSTPQPNGWSGSWPDFFRERRLGHQLALAREQGRSDRTLERLGDRLLERLDEWLDLPDEPPCLLHGDLWSGNYLVADSGEPVLIDPAVYYGQREADLAMTHLFGGFSADFYAAYEEEWPLPPGSAERQEIYKLYHLLNHLNLFGGSYRGGCLAVLRRLVG